MNETDIQRLNSEYIILFWLMVIILLGLTIITIINKIDSCILFGSGWIC